MTAKIKVALAGNPNSGKTTVFNALTGARQHVGNYPGVTVERKEGTRRYNGCELRVIDLPGTYSLTAYSAEELVARRVLVEERPEVVVDIIDSSNLERNLYLAVQLLELGTPVVLAFNMSDLAQARGFEFDLPKLEASLGAKIAPLVGNKGKGLPELLAAIAEAKGGERGQSARLVDYGEVIEAEIAKLEPILDKAKLTIGVVNARWLAVKLLENDQETLARLKNPALVTHVEQAQARLGQALGEAPETVIAAKRYSFIEDVCRQAVRSSLEPKRTLSDRIDAVVANRYLGIPLFLILMYLVFHLTFTLGTPPMDWIDSLFGWLGGVVSGWWPEGSTSLLKSLLVDGIIGGVGGVIIFLPNILLLFLAIAILEDSGYMARAAFIMDRLMHRIGLHGKSFIPMLIGFGCSIPAIMATRTLENRRDRLVTMLVVPLMSCGARLPIYALIIPAFFPEAWHAPVLWSIYVIGIVLAILSAFLLRQTVLKGAPEPFVMELPPYRLPSLGGVLMHMWERGWLYLKKAGTIILGITIILWAMATFPGLPADKAEQFEIQSTAIEAAGGEPEAVEEQLAAVDNAEADAALEYSISGRIGRFMEPIIKPMGFDWRIGTALIGAFAAKEVFVAQLGVAYSLGEADEESESLRETLSMQYSPLVGYCIMLFALISAPCMATIAITKRESNSWGWALFQLGGLTVLAYVVTVAAYQIGRLAGG